MVLLSSLSKYKNTGLLIIRVGLGIMFMFHGYPLLLCGPEKWIAIGGAMKYAGITFLPIIWGFTAAITEVFGGFLLLLGLVFRPVTLLLTIIMIVASIMHLKTGDGLSIASHAIEDAIMFLGLTFIGPGKYSVDKK